MAKQGDKKNMPETATDPAKLSERVIKSDLLSTDEEVDPVIFDRLTEIFNTLSESELKEIDGALTILTGDRERRLDQFARLHNLSRSEQLLLGSMISGRTIVEHAETAQISINTARTHMRHLLEKTGTTGQLDLLRDFHDETGKI